MRPSAASCASRAASDCAPSVERGLLQGVAEQLLRRGELRAKAVDLLVLRARHVALLVQQRLLEGGERLRQLLARAGRAARHLVAQSALERLRVRTQRGLQFGVRGTLRRVVGAAQRQPEGEKKNEDEKRERQPVEQRHGSIVAAGPMRRARARHTAAGGPFSSTVLPSGSSR